MSSSFFPLSIHSLFAASSSSFDTCCDDCPPIVATDPPDPPGLCCWAFSTLFTASLFPLPVPDPCITVDPSVDTAECGGFGVVVVFSAGTTIVTVAGPFAVDTAGVGLDDDDPDPDGFGELFVLLFQFCIFLTDDFKALLQYRVFKCHANSAFNFVFSHFYYSSHSLHFLIL